MSEGVSMDAVCGVVGVEDTEVEKGEWSRVVWCSVVEIDMR